jgi:hypothetical protein
MRRRWWIALSVATVAVIASLFGLSVFFEDAINSENFEKIQEGMTEADIVRLLGRPADEVQFLKVQAVSSDVTGKAVVKSYSMSRKTWRGSRKNIILTFTENGIVNFPFARIEEMDTLIGSVRRWVGLDPPPLTPYRIHGGVGPASSSI